MSLPTSDTLGSPQEMLVLQEQVAYYSELNNRLLNLFHTIAHNLNAYTGNVKLLMDMLDSAAHPEEHKLGMQHLRTVTQDLNETIAHLSQIIYVQNTKEIAKEPLVLYRYLQKVIATVNAYGSRTKAVFINKVPEKTTVIFNAGYLESVLLNFSTNAVKYAHPDRFPIIEFNFWEEEEQQVLTIKDNGIGIDLERYGDSLFGLYQTFHVHEEANGFGLYITKYQIESMQGRVTVASKVGEGTTFTIHFLK